MSAFKQAMYRLVWLDHIFWRFTRQMRGELNPESVDERVIFDKCCSVAFDGCIFKRPGMHR
jgi:hypothetical protein